MVFALSALALPHPSFRIFVSICGRRTLLLPCHYVSYPAVACYALWLCMHMLDVCVLATWFEYLPAGAHSSSAITLRGWCSPAVRPNALSILWSLLVSRLCDMHGTCSLCKCMHAATHTKANHNPWTTCPSGWLFPAPPDWRAHGAGRTCCVCVCGQHSCMQSHACALVLTSDCL